MYQSFLVGVIVFAALFFLLPRRLKNFFKGYLSAFCQKRKLFKIAAWLNPTKTMARGCSSCSSQCPKCPLTEQLNRGSKPNGK